MDINFNDAFQLKTNNKAIEKTKTIRYLDVIIDRELK